MSAILAAETGADLICIQRFRAWPKGEESDPKACRTFRIGERVRYSGFYKDTKLKQNPAGWLVLFEVKGSKRPRQFMTIQTHFVTGDDWERLKRFFARQLAAKIRLRTLPPPKHSQTTLKSNGHQKPPPKKI
jgi:hypothetical protein